MRTAFAYTSARILMFGVAVILLYLAGARGLLLLGLGLVISALASYILLNKQRQVIAGKLNGRLGRVGAKASELRERLNDGTDPEHGPRAAEFARTLQGRAFRLSATRFKLLHAACAGHTGGRTHPDNTVRTCWDADRLDLGRVGIMPDPSYLCTAAARRPEMIFWADGRASLGFVPDLVISDWGLDLAR